MKSNLVTDRRSYRFAIRTSLKAGSYLMNRFHSSDALIQTNEKHDVKLDVDVLTERLIKKEVRRHFPRCGFIGEESDRDAAESSCCWIVDPLDGTVNFAKGIPHFCTSLAFKNGESVRAGAVYDPVRRELFSAARGLGAFLNEKPIRRSGVAKLGDAVVAGGFFKTGSLERGAEIFKKLSKIVLKVRYFGAAALDLCYLACGRVNAYVQYGVHEWDVAAAALIAELAGVKLLIREENDKLDVLAADAEIFDELKSCIEA